MDPSEEDQGPQMWGCVEGKNRPSQTDGSAFPNAL